MKTTTWLAGAWLVLAWTGQGGAAKPKELGEAKKLYGKGSYGKALDKVRKAIQKEPTRASSHYLLGLTLAKLKRWGEAQKAMRKARALDPKIGFTKKSKFQQKLAKIEKHLGGKRAAAPPVAKVPSGVGAPPPLRAPAGANAPGSVPSGATEPLPPPPDARAAPMGEMPRGEKKGPPLWALILLGVSGGVLVISFIRERMTRS